MKTVIDDFTQICEREFNGRGSRHAMCHQFEDNKKHEWGETLATLNIDAMSQFSHHRRNLTDPIKMLTGAFLFISSTQLVAPLSDDSK